MKRDVQISKDTYHVNTICLPIKEEQDIDRLSGEELKLTIAGWGKTEKSESKSDVLIKAFVDYLPPKNCSETFSKLRNEPESVMKITIEETHMCAGGSTKVDTSVHQKIIFQIFKI